MLVDSLINSKSIELIHTELKHQQVGLIYLDIVNFGVIEQKYGRTICDRILQCLKQLISDIQDAGTLNLFMYRLFGDDFFLFVRLPEKDSKQMVSALYETAHEFRSNLQDRLNQILKLGAPPIELYVGTALLHPMLDRDINSILYYAIKRAMYEAKSESDLEYQLQRIEFLEILEHKGVQIHYQPIVSLTTGDVYSYEALTRGPQNTFFASPINLFTFAEKEDSLLALEQMTREKAIQGFFMVHTPCKLFININARVIHDPKFTPGITLKLLEQINLSPQDVVFEITERNSVDDFATFKSVLEHYRKQGYRIAIDDAGAGYSSLQAIAELRPDYIKIDRSLIHNIDRDKVKEILLETFVSFAKKVNCKIIAEGIETELELKKLIELGVHYGQGYLLGVPQADFIGISEDVREIINQPQPQLGMIKDRVTVGDVVRPVKTFDENTPVSEVVTYFNNAKLESGVVIIRRERPIGLVMREKLFQSLAKQYGVALYWNRSIKKIMDGHPLILEVDTTVEIASRLSMARDHERIYDFVVITSAEQLVGIVTIQSLLDTMTTSQLEFARDTNPLTGLPGNKRINREMQQRIALRQSFSIIYADIDFFKWLNDQYGFQKGDMVIQYVADILRDIVRNQDSDTDFIGHIGGDDFILITDNHNPSSVCEEITNRFDRGIRFFYDEIVLKDPVEEGIRVLNREGTPVSAQGLSISLACLECASDRVQQVSLDQIAKQAGRLKKLAKASVGSSYVRDMLT